MLQACLAVVVAALCSAPALSPQKPLDLEKTAAHLLALASDQPRLAHMVIAIDGKGRLFSQAAGMADPTTQLPFTDMTRIPLGALTRDLLWVAFDQALQSGELGWDRPVGHALPALPRELGELPWSDMLATDPAARGETPIPNYLRYVADRDAIRPLEQVLRAHAFVTAGPKPHADNNSMLRAALMQVALENVRRKPWSELLRAASRSLGANGVHASEPRHVAQGVARHDSDADPTPVWHAEVPAANGATAPAPDVAALLRSFLAEQVRHPGTQPGQPFIRWSAQNPPAFGLTYLKRDLDLRGARASVRVYVERDLAVFAFANRARSKELPKLHRLVLEDLLGQLKQEQWMWNTAVEIGGGADGNLAREHGVTFAGELDLWGKRVPIQLRSATAELHAPAGTVHSARLYKNGHDITGSAQVPSLATHRGSLRAELSLRESANRLAGMVSYREWLHDVGEIERLPYPLEMKPMREDAERYPLAPQRAR